MGIFSLPRKCKVTSLADGLREEVGNMGAERRGLDVVMVSVCPMAKIDRRCGG